MSVNDQESVSNDEEEVDGGERGATGEGSGEEGGDTTAAHSHHQANSTAAPLELSRQSMASTSVTQDSQRANHQSLSSHQDRAINDEFFVSPPATPSSSNASTTSSRHPVFDQLCQEDP